MAMLALLCAPALILGLAAIACVASPGLAGLGNPGPHGFAEILYAYTSAAVTNGSAFAGLSANTPFYNLTLALAMFIGRFLVIIPVLADCGIVGGQTSRPGFRRHDAHQSDAVSLFSDRRDHHRRRPDLSPRPIHRTGGRTLCDAGRLALLSANSETPSAASYPPMLMPDLCERARFPLEFICADGHIGDAVLLRQEPRAKP